jgi:hypothetical protein
MKKFIYLVLSLIYFGYAQDVRHRNILIGDAGEYVKGQGGGAGVYFSPSDMALLQIKEGYSIEGFYRYVNFSLTF